MNMGKYGMFFIAAGMAIFGFGCQNAVAPVDTTDKPLNELSIEEATKRIVFQEGSNFVIDQAAFEHEGEIYQGPLGMSQRSVIMEEFTGEGATLRWVHEKRIETEESIQDREAFANEHPDEEGEPSPIYETKEALGGLKSITFLTNHKLYIPMRWPEEYSGDMSGVLWVPKSAYEELTSTRTSTMYLNVIAALVEFSQRHPEYEDAVTAFRDQENAAVERSDTDLFKVEGDLIEYPLRVNGVDIKVHAIRARNWYGEIIVLANYDNPLILKLDVNPPIDSVAAASPEMNLFKDLINYEITAILLSQDAV